MAKSRRGPMVVVIHGPPASGKSTVAQVIRAALSGFGANAEIEDEDTDVIVLANKFTHARDILEKRKVTIRFKQTMREI